MVVQKEHRQLVPAYDSEPGGDSGCKLEQDLIDIKEIGVEDFNPYFFYTDSYHALSSE